MAAFGSAGFGAAAYNPNKSAEVPSPPSDGISSLKFSPASNLLVATSWSGQVLCWDVQSNGQAIPKAAITADKPVLCSAWSVDGTTVFAGGSGRQPGRRGRCAPPPLDLPPAARRECCTHLSLHCSPPSSPRPAGGCDNGVKMWNLQTNQQQQVAQHAAPVRHCFFIRQMNMLVTGRCGLWMQLPLLLHRAGPRGSMLVCLHALLGIAAAWRVALPPLLPQPERNPLPSATPHPSCAAGTRRSSTGTCAPPTRCTRSRCRSGCTRWTWWMS